MTEPTAVDEGRRRVAIEGVTPEIDGGRFPVKRIVGDEVVVDADVFADGHEAVACAVRHRPDGGEWSETRMDHVDNDRWRGTFTVTGTGRHLYTIVAWVDRFATWRRDLAKKVAAGLDVAGDLEIGADLVDQSASEAGDPERRTLLGWAEKLRAGWRPGLDRDIDRVLAPIMDAHPDRSLAATYGRELVVTVDRERARFGAWYEMFPRSASPEPDRHGTLADVERRLSYVAGLGFDVLYLPPIHPIGRAGRKGKNNETAGGPDAPGVPWAIGSEEGGHTAIHPDLGTLEDFDRLVARAADHGMEVALDLAFQASPDHPWVRKHPEWFRQRPDGTIQYAENPPKRYEDIFPLDFETQNWRELWDELRDVVLFWVEHGVRIFRVDNPHTKPFVFWEWLIGEVKSRHPDVILLSEAFTRPKVMYRLAKLGFSQSYTYFTWRNTKQELTEYFTELTTRPVREFFRPILWPSTPDILHETLQTGGRAAFIARLVLAATLGASYGIYGPPFEHMEATPWEPGSEEYLHSEKYEIRHWDLDRADSLAPIIGKVNRIRRENPALHTDEGLRFHRVDNDELLAYTKSTPDRSNIVLVVVNLDPRHTQSGWVELPLADLKIDAGHPFEAHELLTDTRQVWHGRRNLVEIDPRAMPTQVFRIRRRVRSEDDFGR